MSQASAEAAPAPSTTAPSPPPAPVAAPPPRRRVEYYKEENFQNLDLTRTVHLGWGALGGAAAILFCMGMSMATQARSWNVSFMWLQRRVGAQFGTMSYIITSNLLYYHDGDRWVTRDWPSIMERWTTSRRRGSGGGSGRGAGAAMEQ
ncbi:hypothetical protein HYH02_009942 [Chlamydomonas schloesseri]|uniref:Uncharacterized protein n=1 Tax=Chlamydomonas schloesseri TaxID=2026947 RepID=A0A835TP04_9CHLO|nr:hypothetical protein HYH02_009942 [Chlamydomonas schloesseri]|eukprot:KAG2441350.1 hypothetical protein HYH02_009942 [Chlamydomonas schloesseri]